MLEGLDQVLPYIKNIALAAVILLAAYLLTIPLRRRYGPSFGVEPKRLGRRLEGIDLDDTHEHVRMDRSVSIPAVLDQRIHTLDHVRSPGQVVACPAFDD